jgi:hypothetical protein
MSKYRIPESYAAPKTEHREAPSRLISRPKILRVDEFGKHWECPEYYGVLREYDKGFFVGGGPYKVLSITATDETALHDWREFQQLKNHLCGPEWEAIELYPAESRLKDPSNRFYLWAVPRGVLVFGLPGQDRVVLTSRDAPAPQRPFHDER